jgi:type I restriction enzyme, S subunit
MKPDRLLQHFDDHAEAPDAVPRLRRFILDLAVRGKLVEQDPTDEPASELLNRIETEKWRLLAVGEIKRQEPLPAIAAEEMPFPLPSGWCVQRMGWLAKKLGAGSTPLGGKSVYQEEGVPFLRSQNVHDDGVRLDDVALISRSIHEEMSGTHVQPQDILLNITGASIGRCALVPSGLREGNVSQHVAIIRLFFPDIREFVHLSLISPTYQQMIRDVEVGVSREGLSMRSLRLFPMILPPLAEQHRIVVKVDELMALCDELEAAQAKRERRRDRLVSATLHGLNNGDASADPGVRPTFQDSARFYFNHLPRLATRHEHIHQLRQTILNLAVRGRLVPQDQNSQDSLGDLRRLEWQGENEDAVFPIPASWFRIEVGNLIREKMTNGISIPGRDVPPGIPALKLNAITPRGIDDSIVRYLPLSVEKARRLTLQKEDFLLARGNGSRDLVARGAAVMRQPDRATIFPDTMIRIRLSSWVSVDWFCHVWNSPLIRAQIVKQAKTAVGLWKISQYQVSRIILPLPPLAEQHRIVSKVDELMALCDELEARLTTTATTRRQLLEATLHEALGIGL